MEYNVPKGGRRRSISLIVAYKLLASQDQLTEENIHSARILAWCMEIVSNFILFLSFTLYYFIYNLKFFTNIHIYLFTSHHII